MRTGGTPWLRNLHFHRAFSNGSCKLEIPIKGNHYQATNCERKMIAIKIHSTNSVNWPVYLYVYNYYSSRLPLKRTVRVAKMSFHSMRISPKHPHHTTLNISILSLHQFLQLLRWNFNPSLETYIGLRINLHRKPWAFSMLCFLWNMRVSGQFSLQPIHFHGFSAFPLSSRSVRDSGWCARPPLAHGPWLAPAHRACPSHLGWV